MDAQRTSQLKNHIQQFSAAASHDLSEADTRAEFIDPVLRILGYVAQDVRREVQVPATKEFLDYELRRDGKTLAIVEAKALRHVVSDQHAAQCVQYASILGVRWCVITNGGQWTLYDAHVTGALPAKRVAGVSLTETSLDECLRFFDVLSKEKLHDPNALGALFIERVIEEELGRPDSAAVGALRNVLRSRYGVKVGTDQIAARLRTRLERQPQTATKPENSHNQTAPSSKALPPLNRMRRQHLIDAGVLPADASITAMYKGQPYSAQLRDGKIEMDGQSFKTLSAAASSITNTAVNGWAFWSYNGVTLRELRDRLKQG